MRATFTQGGIQYDYERYNYLGFYGQDTWKITSHLTVNAGLRWEPFIGGYMPLGYVMHFDPTLFEQNVHSSVYTNAPAGVLFPGDTGFDTNSRPSHMKWNVFAPRFGAVWDPQGNGRMTIRASFGVFSEMPHTLFAYGFSQAPPWGSTVTLNNVSFDNPWATSPGGDPFPLRLDKNALFPVPANYTTYPLDLRTTYLEQWNLSIQKQIATNWLLSASYLGSHGVHTWSDQAINAAVFGPGASTANTNQRRVFYLQNPSQGQYFGTIHSLDDGGTASYHALLLSAQHRLASHFTVLANYTWSHCITDPFTSELDGVQYTNPTNRHFDRGNCVTIDRRHLVNLSGVFEAPKFSGRAMQALAGNWKLSTSMRIQSGQSLTVGSGLDQALNGIGGQRPNLVGNPYPDHQTFSQWLNPAAFAQPAAGTFGNLGAGGNSRPRLVLARRRPVPYFRDSGKEKDRAPLGGFQRAQPRPPAQSGIDAQHAEHLWPDQFGHWNVRRSAHHAVRAKVYLLALWGRLSGCQPAQGVLRLSLVQLETKGDALRQSSAVSSKVKSASTTFPAPSIPPTPASIKFNRSAW